MHTNISKLHIDSDYEQSKNFVWREKKKKKPMKNLIAL